ncbi:uncharacterized protein LOC120316322 [Crotalus tigris]|uniref:uncharacterized protein LOC120316322 n=1 Tax=Crotalus tigris TaxID=88082 RepID=UPI00192F245B|nr:uncharacterized protein LOC120316322 [Crotalus tigris]XP_039217702.1 uncharacterized protein LOC120316322 [Crotalus tigris]
MQTLQSILCSVDLMEAYLHIPILPDHRRFLRFCYMGHHFQYKGLPFGLLSAPRVFTKILAVLAAHLRLAPVRIQCYLDDILIQSPSLSATQLDLALSRPRVLGEFSKEPDGSLDPPRPPRSGHRHRPMQGLPVSGTSGQHPSPGPQGPQRARGGTGNAFPVTGKDDILHRYCALGQTALQELQWFLLPFQRLGTSSSNQRLRVSAQTLNSLRWWSSSAVARGSSFKEPIRLTLTTDTSLFGWGAHLQSQLAQGQWSQLDLRHNINWLELRAIHLALRHLCKRVARQHMLVLTDNMAKAHMNRQGGTWSRSLMAEAQLLGS